MSNYTENTSQVIAEMEKSYDHAINGSVVDGLVGGTRSPCWLALNNCSVARIIMKIYSFFFNSFVRLAVLCSFSLFVCVCVYVLACMCIYSLSIYCCYFVGTICFWGFCCTCYGDPL